MKKQNITSGVSHTSQTSISPPPSQPSISDCFLTIIKWFSENCGCCCTCGGKI